MVFLFRDHGELIKVGYPAESVVRESGQVQKGSESRNCHGFRSYVGRQYQSDSSPGPRKVTLLLQQGTPYSAPSLAAHSSTLSYCVVHSSHSGPEEEAPG